MMQTVLHTFLISVEFCCLARRVTLVISGAIIGDGDRKQGVYSRESWDPRQGICAHPWYGTIFLFFRRHPRTCRGRSRGRYHVAWSNYWEWRDSLADVSQRWQWIRQGIRSRALICSLMLCPNRKGEFFRVENKTSILRFEWIIFARTSWTRKLLPLFCKEKLWKKTLYSGN